MDPSESFQFASLICARITKLRGVDWCVFVCECVRAVVPSQRTAPARLDGLAVVFAHALAIHNTLAHTRAFLPMAMHYPFDLSHCELLSHVPKLLFFHGQANVFFHMCNKFPSIHSCTDSHTCLSPTQPILLEGALRDPFTLVSPITLSLTLFSFCRSTRA